MFTDYLGSILKVVDGNGNTKEEQSFDAWGRKRNPANWQVYDAPEDALPKTLTWLSRGYTGHEHLYQFGIINMNNRLYDPIVGRMLAVDNFVADSESTQAYNRYSYVMNNPLKYVDPSGDLIQNGIRNLINGDPFLFNSGNALVMNTIQAAFSFGIGQAAMPFGVSLLAHGHLGGVMTAVQGGKYHQGFLSGSAGSLVGHGAGKIGNTAIRFGVSTLGAGVVGGGASNLAGGNFWDGFRNGVIASSLNHLLHAGNEAILKEVGKNYFGKTIDFKNSSNEQIIKHVLKSIRSAKLNGLHEIDFTQIFDNFDYKNFVQGYDKGLHAVINGVDFHMSISPSNFHSCCQLDTWPKDVPGLPNITSSKIISGGEVNTMIKTTNFFHRNRFSATFTIPSISSNARSMPYLQISMERQYQGWFDNYILR